MASMAAFLERLFGEGAIGVGPTRLPSEPDAGSARILERAFDVYTLDLPGPPLCFEPTLAERAGRILHDAAWYFLHPGQDGLGAERDFRWEVREPSLAQHLSVDLVFRYLPTLHRRVKAVFPQDFLVPVMEKLLRSWPLSGVLSEVSEPPTVPADFENHLGLTWWYAERWVRRAKPSWLPTGRMREYVELAWQAAGRGSSGEWRVESDETP